MNDTERAAHRLEHELAGMGAHFWPSPDAPERMTTEDLVASLTIAGHPDFGPPGTCPLCQQ